MNYKLSQFHEIICDNDLFESKEFWDALSETVNQAMNALNYQNDSMLDPATMNIYVNKSASRTNVQIQDNFTPTIKITEQMQNLNDNLNKKNN